VQTKKSIFTVNNKTDYQYLHVFNILLTRTIIHVLPSFVPSAPIIIDIEDIICCVTAGDVVQEYIEAWDWIQR